MFVHNIKIIFIAILSMATYYDTVIIGAGFTGLYSAYELLKSYPEMSIGIFEKGSRVGGRIMTEQVQGHIQEYGPMRFEPELQPNFSKLLKELCIPTKIFTPYTSPCKDPNFNDIWFEEVQAIVRDRSLAPPFAILKHAFKKILDEQWDVENDDIHDMYRDEKKEWLKRYGTFQGQYIHMMGIWDILAHVLSKPALDYVVYNGTFYHMIAVNPNAADVICFILDIIATCKFHLITIDGGSNTLIEKLLKNVAKHVDMKLDHNLETFLEFDENIELKFRNGEVTSCKRLILTCQQSGMQTIYGFDDDIKHYLNSVILVKLFKLFIVIENPPWDEDTIPSPNFNADKLPCREIHYYYNKTNKTGMVMLYGDVPTLNYWKSFVPLDADYVPLHNDNSHLKNHVNHYLRIMFPHHRHFNIIDYCLMDWSSEPHETGCHFWKPKFVSSEIIEKLSQFGKNNNIHICGETYSNYQGFIEGCVRTAKKVLSKI